MTAYCCPNPDIKIHIDCCPSAVIDQLKALTFDGEVHGLADISSHVVADLTQVKAIVILQHVFYQQRTIAQQLDARAAVQKDGLKLGDTCTCSIERNNKK